jgi:hypothetical protein
MLAYESLIYEGLLTARRENWFNRNSRETIWFAVANGRYQRRPSS